MQFLPRTVAKLLRAPDAETCPVLHRSVTLLLLLAALAFPALSHATNNFPMQVQRLAIQEGLSQNTVLDTLQDSQGFVWLATENGLNRFDGYKITRYHRNTDTGLPDDFVYSLAEDQDANLWIGTARGGIARWVRSQDKFETVPVQANGQPVQHIRKLLVARNNELWIGTHDRGLLIRAASDGHIRHFVHDPADPTSLPANRINTLFQDRGGLMWVGTEAGLARFDPATNSFVRIARTNSAMVDQTPPSVRAIHEDHQGIVWFGSDAGGLHAYHRSNGQLTRYLPDATANGYCSGTVSAIVEDLSHRLWSATDHGLCMFDRTDLRFAGFGANDKAGSLGDNDLRSLMLDRSGQLWIGTRSDGINLWNPQSWQLGHTFADLPLGSVSAFATDQHGFWVGSTSNGLLRARHNMPPRFITENDGLTDNRVMALATSSDGGLWVGTMKGGLQKLTNAGEVVQQWVVNPADGQGQLPAAGVMSLLEDSAGRLWAGLFGGGVARLDSPASTFVSLLHTTDHPTGLRGSQVMALVEDLTGTIWAGTEVGLNRFDEASNQFEAFTHNSADPNSLAAESVYALHVDASGTLWAGTAGGGLNRVITEPSVRFEQTEELMQLGMNLIYGVRSDPAGNLWLSGNRGLVRYNPETRAAKRYRQAHGLQGDEFNFGAHHAGVDGHLYFGGTNGFNRFDPTELNTPSAPPTIAITRIQLSGKELAGRFPASTDALTVSYTDEVVTFEFAALDFVDANSNRFEYRLRGHEESWIDSGTSRRISYSNIRPGSYTFEVRGANSAGVWNTNPTSLRVEFEPPPWRSAPAYGMYTLIVLFLGWLVYRAWLRRRANARRHRAELHRLAYFDALTKLPNRHQLQDTGDALIAANNEQHLSVMHVNLDHFKRLNDSLGHATADRLLVEFAGRLRQHSEFLCSQFCTPMLARIGGDEFAVIVPDIESPATANVLAARLQTALSETLRVDRAEALVTVSVGVALYPNDGESIVELLKCADIAMRGAKQTGRNTFQSFEPAMIKTTEADLQLEAELHAAIESDQLSLYYQPKVLAQDQSVCGAEALIRWHHPERGLVSPGLFIPMAERSGLISQIDRWVLKQAFAQQEIWCQQQFPRIITSLNVSAGQFARGEFIDYLRELNTNYSIDPGLVEIEITEGVLMQDARAARKTLSQIKDLGFRVAIDDFGTGYSSLSYLKNFAVDVLKIDQSFVSDLETDASNRSICRAVLGLARSLGLEVVAEGVETEAQFNFLRDEGCEQIQGYWISRPQPLEEFASFVLERAAAPQNISNAS